MKLRQKSILHVRKRQRTRLLCERLEPRLLLAVDDGSDASDLLDAIDSLTFTSVDDGTAEVSDEGNLASDPGSLDSYLSDNEAILAAADDDASVDAVLPPEPR